MEAIKSLCRIGSIASLPQMGWEVLGSLLIKKLFRIVADNILKIFAFCFLEKIWLDILCELCCDLDFF